MKEPQQLPNQEEIQDSELIMIVSSGKNITKEEIKKKIQQTHDSKLQEQGKILLVPYEPSNWILYNYYATVAYKPGVSLYTSAISKINTQFTATNSIISTMAFVCILASAYYEISWKVNSKLDWEMYNKESEIAKGARWLYNMVSAAHKNLQINI